MLRGTPKNGPLVGITVDVVTSEMEMYLHFVSTFQLYQDRCRESVASFLHLSVVSTRQCQGGGSFLHGDVCKFPSENVSLKVEAVNAPLLCLEYPGVLVHGSIGGVDVTTMVGNGPVLVVPL